MRHLTIETILEQIDGEAGADARREIDEHVKVCVRCRDELAEVSEMVGFLREDSQNEPPAEALAWSVSLFQPVIVPEPRPSGHLFRIARCVFDSYESAVGGVRAAAAPPRQLLYRAGAVDVDLRFESAEGRTSLTGQILSGGGSFPEPTRVRLESGGQVRQTTSTNAIGEFSFEAVPDEACHLALDLPEGELRLFCVNQRAPA
jgi:anti-sigma factor RsiW